ncbi:hypothetical protein PHMEG_0003881 [Phytophthora megakarya]|uniref:Uncharacterized protein n=1 Tax=Phytophthora megakarya TaxID=4795 RepID=A0A225WV87_9STRA|nr:hypothetical protein PHMEG_0003881 [Phytophthora megakarya]
MVSDFGDDPDVHAAMGSEAQKVGYAFEEATELAARRHQRLTNIHQALQSVSASGYSLEDSDEEGNDDKPPSPAIREYQLRSTIDALHREKDAMVVQLQDALRLQQESRVANEQQAQELTKAQRALRAQTEELRIIQENNEKATEASNTLTASWRDKFQASAKAAAAAEAKVLELESKVRAQGEEIMKHTFVLQAKMQEMEHFKESEAARHRAEAAAHAAALAEAEAETRRVKTQALEAKRKTKINIEGSNKELQELEDKGEPGENEPGMDPDEDTFSSSDSEADDSDFDEEDEEVEQDERELNRVMLEVVTSVFPALEPAETDMDLDESIAQYEDPTRSPLNEIQPKPVNASPVDSKGDMVPRSELDKLRKKYNDEIDTLKQQYVAGLQEYKKLVLDHGRLRHIKESLKVLYNSLRQHPGPALASVEEGHSAIPLKTLLRAAILTMSMSRKRQRQGRTQIEAIHEQLTKTLPDRTRAVAAAMMIHNAIGGKNPISIKKNVSSQTETLLSRDRVEDVERVAPESLDGFVLPGSSLFPSRSKQQNQLHLTVGIPFSDVLVVELRRMLPSLPPGNYHISSALRLALFHELVRFYAAVEVQAEARKTRSSPRAKQIFPREEQIQEAEIVIGSPRNTPFLRRKALETIENKTRQRNSRHLFTSGGVAILQATFTSTSR